MTVTKVTLVDSPEKMRNQDSGYSIIMPQVRDMLPLSKQKKDEKGSYSDFNQKE